LGVVAFAVETLPARSRSARKKKSTSRRPRRRKKVKAESEDYIAIGLRETLKVSRAAAKWAAPRLKRGAKKAAPKIRVAVVTGSKKGLEALRKGGKGVVSISRDLYWKLSTRKERRELEMRKKALMFEGKLTMRPAHVILTKEEYERLKRGE